MDAGKHKCGNDFKQTDDPGQSTNDPIDHRMLAGLGLLWQAYVYARDVRADLWDFALRTEKLYETGATICDLRWLVAKRIAEHAQETSVHGAPHRSFRRGEGFFLDDTTCLVLTPSGAALAERVLQQSAVLPQSILSTFEEEGWPKHIDDPLPFTDDINPPTRLHDAINRLNGHQSIPLLRFHGNGNGDGICWEIRNSD